MKRTPAIRCSPEEVCFSTIPISVIIHRPIGTWLTVSSIRRTRRRTRRTRWRRMETTRRIAAGWIKIGGNAGIIDRFNYTERPLVEHFLITGPILCRSHGRVSFLPLCYFSCFANRNGEKSAEIGSVTTMFT